MHSKFLYPFLCQVASRLLQVLLTVKSAAVAWEKGGECVKTKLRNSMEKCTLPHMKETAGGNWLFDAGSSTQCPVTAERGWGGGGMGGFEGRGHVYAYG